MHDKDFTSLEDFVFNSSFREWLIDNNSIHKVYWENWIKEHPEKVQLLNYAKGIVYALTVKHKQLSETEIDYEVQSILKRTNTAKIPNEEVKKAPSPRKSGRHLHKKFALAVAIIGFSIFSIRYLATKSSESDRIVESDELPDTPKSSITERENNSDSIQLVEMFDGSRVQLYPKSKLSFSKDLFTKKREVYLAGEAFFNIKKDPSLPFVVYTKSLITKVLGTGFNIKAYPFENQASVQVKTGKVAVYRKENFSDQETVANKLDGLVVISNQQVTYDFANKQLRKTIIDEPVLLTNNPTDFVFNSTPLVEVFKILQNTYGISIIYDESIVNSCSLSASMGDLSFYEKLEVICKAMNASYESIDGTILISSPGCK